MSDLRCWSLRRLRAYNAFNTDASAYSAYEFFTSAHQGTAGDQSLYFSPAAPVHAGGASHIELALSRSKHATYPFNPNNMPLTPYYYMYAGYAGIQALYDFGFIDYYEYQAAYYALDNAFFVCIVERFSDQGGAYAVTRINVGEPDNPINGSHFIQDRELHKQLTTPLF